LSVEDFEAQDEFFAQTGAAVFTAVASGQGDPVAAVSAMAQAARNGGLMIWSDHEIEQQQIAGTVLSGELSGTRGESPVVGVFLNDGSASKIGFYLESDVRVDPGQCNADGSQIVELTVTLTSTAPADAA